MPGNRDGGRYYVMRHDSQCIFGIPRYALDLDVSDIWKHLSQWERTKCFTVAYFCSPASNQVHSVRFDARHFGIPFTNQRHVFVDFVRLDLVENYGMHVFAAGEDLREG